MNKNNENIKVGFVSLGCPKNLTDTEAMLYTLVEEGFELVADETEADVIVLNTCAFIKSAREEAEENIRDITWLKENKSLKGIVVAGCYAQMAGRQIFSKYPSVSAVIGVGSCRDISAAVRAAYNGERFYSANPIIKSPMGDPRIVTTPEYFAYLKIAEGCDNCCSYCAIPSLRGKFRSRPLDEIVEEANSLAELGVREVCLVAQDTTRYGEDLYGTYSLDALISEISQIEGIKQIRLLYCYPDRITDALIEEIATNDKVVKYIDMPIQHISDNVLKRMNRRDTEKTIREVITKLRARIPDIVLRTTVLVGFPGETKADFEKLLSFVKEMKFERLGAFAYSREKGTAAYDMPDQIRAATKEHRVETIMNAQYRIQDEFNRSRVGKVVDAVCEGYDAVAGKYFGRTYADAPEIDGKIYFEPSRKLKEGDMVRIKVTEALDYDIMGVIVD